MSLWTIVTLVAVGAALALALLVAALAQREPRTGRRRVEALFRRPSKPAKPPDPDHYYRPYWS